MLPFGREFATARRGATAATDMLSVVITDFVGVPESATPIVKFELPAAVGVPLIVPVAGFRESPLGRVPAIILQVRAPLPPAARKEAE
jgi:hypothetical protein